MDLLARRTLVDANHGNTHGPCGLANREQKVRVCRLDVLAGSAHFDDLPGRKGKAHALQKSRHPSGFSGCLPPFMEIVRRDLAVHHETR
jgi:hypothetical protein